MLTELRLENFKAWRELTMEFGRITALFGENSSGKSSVLQFLLLLKQTKDATDRGLVLDFGGGPNEKVDLGDFKAAVHRGAESGDGSADMEWSLSWQPYGSEAFRLILFGGLRGMAQGGGDQVRSTARVGYSTAPDRRLIVKRLAYEYRDVEFELKLKADRERFELACSDETFLKEARSSESAIQELFGWSGTLRDGSDPPSAEAPDPERDAEKGLPGPVKTHLFPPETRQRSRAFYDVVGGLEASYEGLMDRIFYLGPLRDRPRRYYTWSGARPAGVGDSGEYAMEALFAASARKQGDCFQGRIARNLKELGLSEAFSVREFGEGRGFYEVVAQRHEGGPEATLADVGIGVSQVLPVLVLLHYVPEGSIVLLEQPELHLHPSVQSRLADVMLDVARERDLQVVVESHSEHLLRRFQRRVAEGKAALSELTLYFVNSGEGEAELDPLRLNEWGGIENWPEHFFGDEFGEIAATSRAGLKRRTKANG
jgi:hypothetical protein